MKKIDHIVYAVQDLDAAILAFEKKLGVRPLFGGFHKSFGTKNALINLGEESYLELLAADNTNIEVDKPRWMGIDLLQKNQLTRWAVKSEQLKKDAVTLKKWNPAMGEVRSGSRNTSNDTVLQWKLSMPLAQPEVELVPFLLDWSSSEKHPVDDMPDMSCRLVELHATHPAPEKLALFFKELEIAIPIVKTNIIQLKAIIECPKGRIEI